MKKYIAPSAVFVLVVKAADTVSEHRYSSRTDAEHWAAFYEAAGASATVETRVRNLPPLPAGHSFVRAKVAGPDAIWS